MADKLLHVASQTTSENNFIRLSQFSLFQFSEEEKYGLLRYNFMESLSKQLQ